MSVYVRNKHGHPLMPCTPAKARRLLKSGKAKVVKRTPFTIQLLYGSSGYKQPIVLGVDAGSKTIGLAACTKQKVLFSAEVKPRNDVVDLLSTRREFRRSRRNRTTRYRPSRFLNRTHAKHKGWLAPSVEVKIQEHITPILRVCSILPVSRVIVETAEFDLQLIKAVEQGLPVPQGEDYQKGEMLGHYNIRQYVLFRDGYTCRCCGRHGKGVKLHVHHLESRKTGGNAPNNEITLCEDCHKKLHKGIIREPQFQKRRSHSTRDAAFMGIMRKTLMCRLREQLDIPVQETHVKVMPGTYNCYAYMGRNCWGTRCWFAQIVIADGPYNEIAEDKVFSGRSWRSIGSIGVDAGMAGFFHHKPDFNDEEWDIVCNAPRKSDADAYLESFSCNGENRDGFWTGSGVGDGEYTVYAIRDKKKIVALEIRFWWR